MSVLDIAGHLSAAPSTPARPAPAFLTNFAAMHDAMRRDSARLIRAVAGVESPAHAAALRRWWAVFRQVIEHHHGREDDVAWPELRRRDRQFAAVELTLIGDHRALDDAMTRVDRSLELLSNHDADRHRAVIQASAAVVRFDALLSGHLTREEEATFPRIQHLFTAEEWAELEERFVQGISMRACAFLLPWVLDGADDWKTRSILAVVPARIRTLNRLLFRRSYRKLSAPLVVEPGG
jgi:iron-sulfur cluster repair protein YtfE (RIC family)